MNPVWKRWLIRGVKLVLALVVLVAIGWQFQRDLASLDFTQTELRPGWLVASAGLYLVGILPSAWYWRRVLQKFGYPVSLFAAIRASYVGQLGKYVPGKAFAIAIRADLLHPCGVPYGVSIIASFYEVLTGMASGGIVAAVIYVIEPPGELDLHLHPAAIGVILIGLCGIPLLPGVFNFVVAVLTAKIQAIEMYRLPPVRLGTLAVGLLTTGVGWWLQGLSMWAMLQAVVPDAPGLSSWAQCTAAIAFATVAGFVVVFIPGGLGVREFLLSRLLSSLGPAGYISAAAILLRLDWIVAEVFMTVCTLWRKPMRREGEAPAELEAAARQEPRPPDPRPPESA
jgi:glycosyltransferase 2 family protein